MHRYVYPLGLALLLASPAYAQLSSHTGNHADRTQITPAPITLRDAVALALANNPELSAAQRELEAVDATVIQAGARPNPELSALMEDTRKSSRTTTLQINQPIELGGKRQARIDAAERS